LDYILVINGKPDGPFTVEELKQKRIKPTDFVRTDDMDDYKEAHELPELRELFGFRKQIISPQYFGTFDQRATACIIDWFIISAVFVVLTFIVVALTGNVIARALISGSLLVVIPTAYFIYHVIMECSAKQGTYGKQILKIRVTDLEGNRITASKAITRNLAKVLSILTLFIGYLTAYFNKKQQCLHDMIAETLIVKDRLNY